MARRSGAPDGWANSDSGALTTAAATDLFENYDIAGRYREHDDGLPECVIEGSGEIVGVGEFSGPGELSNLLVENDYVDACAVKQFLTFAIGREPTNFEGELVREVTDAFRAGNHDFRELIISFIASDRFARLAEEG